MIINNPAGMSNVINFGYSGNIPIASGSYYEINSFGYSTVSFHAKTPEQGCIQFTSSFDGTNYSPITFRQIGNDGYSQETHDEDSDYIGSVIGAKNLRFLNLSGSLNSGSIVGTLSKEVCILEGTEHSNPPHKIGNALFHLGINLNGAVTNSGLFFPQERHKFTVTYVGLSMSSTAGANITLHEGSDTVSDPSQWIFSTYIKGSAGDTQFINAVLSTPYVATNPKSGLYLSTDGNATVRGVVHGYETES